MFNKVLFLDCEGVLNTAHTDIKQSDGSLGVEPELCAQLSRIVDKTNCDIVLSSAWRKSEENVAYLFSSVSQRVRRAIIGKTPTLYGAVTKCDEIQAWLDANCGASHVKIAIVDDQSDMGHLSPYLIQTDSCLGLTPEVADAIIGRLNSTTIILNDDGDN